MVSAMDWPAPSLLLTQNFGWNDEGRPNTGNTFEGESPVAAAEKGELIFSHQSSDTAGRLPSPLGAWAALDHGDGLISIYSRYEDNQNTAIPIQFERNDPITVTGISGWSGKTGVYFSLYDRRERRWVNPSMIITPFHDTRAPQLHSVSLRNADGRIIELDSGRARNLAQGHYAILVNASDTLADATDRALAPHKIICSVNGAEIAVLNFETLSSRDGVLMANQNGLVPAKQIYAPYPGFEVGEVWFTRGKARLEIIIQDISGNFRPAFFNFTIE
jgi:hypothetical protein